MLLPFSSPTGLWFFFSFALNSLLAFALEIAHMWDRKEKGTILPFDVVFQWTLLSIYKSPEFSVPKKESDSSSPKQESQHKQKQQTRKQQQETSGFFGRVT